MTKRPLRPLRECVHLLISSGFSFVSRVFVQFEKIIQCMFSTSGELFSKIDRLMFKACFL